MKNMLLKIKEFCKKKDWLQTLIFSFIAAIIVTISAVLLFLFFIFIIDLLGAVGLILSLVIIMTISIFYDEVKNKEK